MNEIPEALDLDMNRVAAAALFGWAPPRPDGPAAEAVGRQLAVAVWHMCGKDMGDEAQELDSLATVSGMLRGLESTLPDYVSSARLCGASWEQIGKALGISKQAAQQKYGRT